MRRVQRKFIIASSKRAIILQLGHHFIRAGLDSEDQPRTAVRTPLMTILKTTSLREMPLPSRFDYEIKLAPLLEKLFFFHLSLSPAERPIILIEYEFSAQPLREALAHILFRQFKISSITFLSAMITPLYLCPEYSGLVIDFGYTETRILPVSHGLPLRNAYQTMCVGGWHVNQSLRRLLLDANAHHPIQEEMIRALSEDQVDAIKILSCYVRYQIGDHIFQTNKDLTIKSTEWQFNEEVYNALRTSLSSDERSTEIAKGNFALTIPADVRQALQENSALRYLMKDARLNTVPCSELIRSWIGGSIFAGAGFDELTQDAPTFKAADWVDEKPLPDWLKPAPYQIMESPSTYDVFKTLDCIVPT